MKANPILYAMSESTRLTIRIIASYLQEKGQRCFNYRGLRAYWDKKKMWRTIEWHTVERVVRKLAETGWLERHYDREKPRHVYFCLSDELATALEELGWLRMQ